MKLKLKEFVKIYGDYDVEFSVIGSETGAVEFIKLSKPKPKPTLTEDERKRLMEVPRKYEWVCKQKDSDTLWVYQKKPNSKSETMWLSSGGDLNTAFCHSTEFTFILWEDEEPYNIEELLKGNELC